MYFYVNNEYRTIFVNSLNEKAFEKKKARGGCLIAVLFPVFILFLLAMTMLLSEAEKIPLLLIDRGINLELAQWGEYGVYILFGVAALALIILCVRLAAFAKKNNESADMTVADELRARYGNEVYEAVKKQILADGSYVVVRDQWQKSEINFLTGDWFVYGRSFIKLKDIVCAFPYYGSLQEGGPAVRCLNLLMENGEYINLPLDYSESAMNDVVQLMKQKNPYIYADSVQHGQTVSIILEDGRRFNLSSDKEKLIELHKKIKKESNSLSVTM